MSKVSSYWEKFNIVSARRLSTLHSAMQLFEKMADKNLAFSYSYDGCYARAHLMCRHILKSGYLPGKVWAHQERPALLEVHMPDGSKIEWNWHVAPTLDLIMPDGKIVTHVFDPTLFDGPVSVDEWRRNLNASWESIHLTKLGEAPPKSTGDYMMSPFKRLKNTEVTSNATDGMAKNKLREYNKYVRKEKKSKIPRVVKPSSVREILEQSTVANGQPQQQQSRGKTWVSQQMPQKSA